MLQDKIDMFVDDLASAPLSQNVRNPWDFSRAENQIRRRNLLGYLRKMQALGPDVLLVGEAPGYRGCGRVGMPFSSEKLVLNHSFFADRNIFSIENTEAPMAEASSSIVWNTLDSLNFYPLMWATYPYHPHKPGDILSNRAPKPAEIQFGREFVERMIDIFGIKSVIAVGRVAEKNLAEMGIEALAIRHPARGGAMLFAEGLRSWIVDHPAA